MVKAAGVWMLLLALALPSSVAEACQAKEQAMTHPDTSVHQLPIHSTKLLSETPESTQSSATRT